MPLSVTFQYHSYLRSGYPLFHKLHQGQDLSISGSSFTVYWGDETTSPIGINGSVTKSFDVAEEKTIRIVFESPYLTNQVVKVVNCGESAVSYMRINTEDLIPIRSENNNYINVG